MSSKGRNFLFLKWLCINQKLINFPYMSHFDDVYFSCPVSHQLRCYGLCIYIWPLLSYILFTIDDVFMCDLERSCDGHVQLNILTPRIRMCCIYYIIYTFFKYCGVRVVSNVCPFWVTTSADVCLHVSSCTVFFHTAHNIPQEFWPLTYFLTHIWAKITKLVGESVDQIWPNSSFQKHMNGPFEDYDFGISFSPPSQTYVSKPKWLDNLLTCTESPRHLNNLKFLSKK